MVQSIECLQAEGNICSFFELEALRNGRIDVPVVGTSECVAPHAEISRCSEGKSRGVLKEDRPDDSRLVFETGIRLSIAGEDGARIAAGPGTTSKQRRSGPARYGEGRAGHQSVEALNAPSSQQCVQRRRDIAHPLFPFAEWQFVNPGCDPYVSTVPIGMPTIVPKVAGVNNPSTEDRRRA